MTTELMFASALAVAFVLMMAAYRGADTLLFRSRRRGQPITWDVPERVG